MITLIITKPNIGVLKSNNANNKPSIIIYMINEEVFVLFFTLIYWSSRKNTMPFLSVAPTNNRTGQSPLRKNLESA